VRILSGCRGEAKSTDSIRVCSQPVLADEVQTFKALITIHKVLQEGHPIVIREAQQHTNWIDSLMRGVGGEGLRGMRDEYNLVGAVDADGV
jgi:hypothetical protein